MSWTPANLDELQAWFKADALALSNNDPVQTWSGSEQSRDLTQATLGLRPLFKTNIQNGLPGILFDGVDDYLDGSYAASVAQPRTLVVLASSTNWQHTLSDATSGNRNIVQMQFIGVDPTHYELGLYAGTGPVFGTLALSTSAPVIMAAIFNGTSSKSYINGVADIAQDVGSLSLGAGPRFGANITLVNSFFTGYIFEIIDCAGALTLGQLSDIGLYLEDKWAVTWSGGTFGTDVAYASAAGVAHRPRSLTGRAHRPGSLAGASC